MLLSPRQRTNQITGNAKITECVSLILKNTEIVIIFIIPKKGDHRTQSNVQLPNGQQENLIRMFDYRTKSNPMGFDCV